MELTWTTEKSEKETVKLFLRRRGFLKDLRLGGAILSVFWMVASTFCWFGLFELFDVRLFHGAGIVFPIIGALFLFCFVTIDWFLVHAPRRAYRQRGTHKVEYRLTDDKFSFAAGDTQFSSPWSKVAKKFRIDKKAIYLYGKNVPFEAKCIPDWQGHGVEKKELVATLKKAGLKKTMSGRLKFLIWLVASPIVLAALLTIYFYIGGIEWGDWTIPNEAELRLELRDVPDEENAYLALQALTNLYRVAEGDGNTKEISNKTFVRYYGNPFCIDNDDREKWAAARHAPSSPERAARILADNAEFFKAFHAALSLKGFVDTAQRLEDAKRKREGGTPWVSYLPLYKPFIEFAQLVSLRTQVAIEKGDVESAVSDIGEIHALGQLLKVNNESLVGYLVGALIEKISSGKMCDVVAIGKASDEVIERFSKMVAVSEANASLAWERGLKAEIAMYFEVVEWTCKRPDLVFSWMLNAKLRNSLDPSPSLSGRMLSVWPGFAKFAFHRREMLYRQAMFDRAMLTCDDDLIEMIEHEIPRNPILPNGIGNILIVSMTPIFSQYAKSGMIDRLRPRLVIAAAKWRRAHGGKNPPTLDALVPDYLAAVPKDPWNKSGEPIKYDAALGVAWSVGKEGEYDYRKVVKERADGNDLQVDGDTQKYAFRLDGKSVVAPELNGHKAKTSAASKAKTVNATNDCKINTSEGIKGSGNEIVNGVNWTFVITNGNASVSVIPPSFTAIPPSTSGELTIPPILGGCPVTSIGEFSFNCCGKITCVKIPDSVMSIGSWAFQACRELKGVIFLGNAPTIDYGAFNGVPSYCTIYVQKNSTGWDCAIPGTWNGLKICYATSADDVKKGKQLREKPQEEVKPPADVKKRPWLVPVASCRAAMKGRYDSRVFITGMEQGLTEGELISPSLGKCGYRVLSISDRCVWFEAFYGDKPPEDKLPHVAWPDFSRIDTLPPAPPPGRLMLGKRAFWPGDAIKLPNSGSHLMVNDLLEGRGAVFHLLDSSFRPIGKLLCVIVREEK